MSNGIEIMLNTFRGYFHCSFRHYFYGCLSLVLLYFIYLHLYYQNQRHHLRIADIEHELEKIAVGEEDIDHVIQPEDNRIDEVKPKETFLEGGGPGSKVIATFYVEAQCPDTTRFVHSQLWPAWQKLYETNRIIWRIIPFGKASCEPQQNNDFSCECQHGHTECELNQLMNCAIQILRHIDQYMPLINCIQGKVNLLDARKECLDGKYETVSSLLDCATGPEGRRLLAEAGEATELLKPRMTFIPWITLDGVRSVDAMYDLTENLCNSLIPQPIQCTNDAVDSNLIKPKS